MSRKSLDEIVETIKRLEFASSERFMKEATKRELAKQGYHNIQTEKKVGGRRVDVKANGDRCVVCECESMWARFKERIPRCKNVLVLPFWIHNYDEVWITGLEEPKIISKIRLRKA